MAGKTYIIGRRGEITLNDDTVSGRHAELTVDDGHYFLADLGSTNGTWQMVDGQRLPFSKGAVGLEQEFSFGNCCLSIRQLLDKVRPVAAGRSSPGAVVVVAGGSGAGASAEAEGERRRCRGCGAVIMASELRCPACGSVA